MSKPIAIAGTVLGFLIVAIGAFGAHGLKDHFTAHPELAAYFETALFYHAIHALAILVIGFASDKLHARFARIGAWAMTGGVLLFSGSLYAMSISGARSLGMITPIGGFLFLIGWVSTAIGILKAPR